MMKNEHTLPAQKERTRCIKAIAKTNSNYGKYPEELTITELIENGIVILDKPAGPTSHQVVAWLRDILELPKVGHGGTLDPGVTGILTVALGNSTKALQVMLLSGKEYVCRMKLHNPASKKKIKEVCGQMVGSIHQVPPLRSAVKRVRRSRNIYYLDIIQIKDNDVLFKVGCEAGTYIRTLCVDIGRKLGTGAQMAELRRTRVGVINEGECVNLHDLKDAYAFYKDDGDETELRHLIQPLNRLLDNVPKIIIRDSAIDAICHGADLALPGVLQVDSDIKKGDILAIMSLKDEGVALARSEMSTEQMLQKDIGVCATLERVIMNKGTYPPLWKTS